MHLGISFFWILGYSSTYLLFHSYELARARTSSYECKKVSGRFPDAIADSSNVFFHFLLYSLFLFRYTGSPSVDINTSTRMRSSGTYVTVD